MTPGNPLHTFPFNVILLKMPGLFGSSSLNLIFLGETPPTVAVASRRMLLPNTSRVNAPLGSLSRTQPFITGTGRGTETHPLVPGGTFGGQGQPGAATSGGHVCGPRQRTV